MEVLDLLGSIRALVPERPNDSIPVEPASSASVVLPPKEKEELIEDPPLPAKVQADQPARTVDQATATDQPGLEEVPLPSSTPVRQDSLMAAEPEPLQSAAIASFANEGAL